MNCFSLALFSQIPGRLRLPMCTIFHALEHNFEMRALFSLKSFRASHAISTGMFSTTVKGHANRHLSLKQIFQRC